MNMYNYFLKARVSLRTLSSLVINLFTQVAIVFELALVSSHVFADGINRCKPLLIFYSDPIRDKRRHAEEKLYDPRVCTAFNKTA
jgi:hypothetical protein